MKKKKKTCLNVLWYCSNCIKRSRLRSWFCGVFFIEGPPGDDIVNLCLLLSTTLSQRFAPLHIHTAYIGVTLVKICVLSRMKTSNLSLNVSNLRRTKLPQFEAIVSVLLKMQVTLTKIVSRPWGQNSHGLYSLALFMLSSKHYLVLMKP